jgi:hypothetical protein
MDPNRKGKLKMTQPPSKTTFAASCGLPVAPTKLPALPRPDGALIEREHSNGPVTITAMGCDAVRAWAVLGCTQGAIASELGISMHFFKRLLGTAGADPASPLRLAWEAGFSVNESNLIRSLNILALNGNLTAQIVLLKMVHDRRDAGPQVVVETGARINIVAPEMPGSFPSTNEGELAYMKTVGQEAIIDIRSNKTIREHYTLQGKSPEEATKYLISLGRNPNDQDFAPKLIELNPAKMIAIPGDKQEGN